jgi:integrase
VRPKRKWREAATKYLLEEAIYKDSGKDDAYRLKALDAFIGELVLHEIHDATLAPFIEWRRHPVEVERKCGKAWVKQVKTKTINLDLGLVRHILNLAARKWRDEHGLTWLETAPLISMLKVRDARPPYPLSWAEQRLLLPELPEHQAEVCLFLLNSGLRSESEAVRLDWRWEVRVPALNSSVFLIPGDSRKNEQEHVCVLNSVARSIIERCRGKHPTAVFTYRARPLGSVNNTAWVNARAHAVAKYEEKLGEAPPEGFKTLHVHDLRHTVGRRLRAAGVLHETRQAILGHKSGSITTHYSAAELRELLDAMELVATDNLRESHALTLLKRKAG